MKNGEDECGWGIMWGLGGTGNEQSPWASNRVHSGCSTGDEKTRFMTSSRRELWCSLRLPMGGRELYSVVWVSVPVPRPSCSSRTLTPTIYPLTQEQGLPCLWQGTLFLVWNYEPAGEGLSSSFIVQAACPVGSVLEGKIKFYREEKHPSTPHFLSLSKPLTDAVPKHSEKKDAWTCLRSGSSEVKKQAY